MSFTCPRCGRTSHNPNDERERYCGFCHLFVDEAPQFDSVTHFADVQARLAISTHCWCANVGCERPHLRDVDMLRSLLAAIIQTYLDERERQRWLRT